MSTSRSLFSLRLFRVFSCIGLLSLLLVSCGSDEPVVVVTLLGLSSEVNGVRVHARLNTAPAHKPMVFQEGLGPATVDYQFAVRLPRGSQGSVSLSIQTLTSDFCYVSDDPEVVAQISPGQVVPVMLTVSRLPQTLCPLRLEKTSTGPGFVEVQAPSLDCSKPELCRCTGSCEFRLPKGSSAILRADGENQTKLLAWGTDCGGFGGCSLTMNREQKVTAEFMPTLRVRRTGKAASDSRAVIRSILPDAVRAKYGLNELACQKSLADSQNDPGSICSIGVPPETRVRISGPSGGPPCFLGFSGGAGCDDLSCEVTVNKDPVEITADLAKCERSTPFPKSGENYSVFATPELVWVGSKGASGSSPEPGLHYLDRAAGTWTALSTDYTEVRALWADRLTGDLWYAGNWRSYSGYLVHLSQRGMRQLGYVSINGANYYAITALESNRGWLLQNDLRLHRFDDKGIQMNFFSGNYLYGISVVSPSLLWLVGGSGVAYRCTDPLNTLACIAVSSGSKETLNDIWSFDEQNAWAVGEKGSVTRWNGVSWTSVGGATAANLAGVWGTTPRNVWAVGSGVVLYWNGTKWNNVVADKTNFGYVDIHGADEGTFWAVDSQGGVTTFER